MKPGGERRDELLVERYTKRADSNSYNHPNQDSMVFESEIVHVWDPVRITLGLIILFVLVFLVSRFTFSSDDQKTFTTQLPVQSPLVKQEDKPTALLETITGKVKVSPSGDESDYWAAATSEIGSGHVIKTSHGSQGRLRMKDGTEVEFGGNTELRIRLRSERTVLDFFAGQVAVKLTSNTMGKPFEISIGSLHVHGKTGSFEVHRRSQKVEIFAKVGSLALLAPEYKKMIESGQRVSIALDLLEAKATVTNQRGPKRSKPKTHQSINLVSTIKAVFPKNKIQKRKVAPPVKTERPSVSLERIRSFRKEVQPRTLRRQRNEAARPLELPDYTLGNQKKPNDLLQYEEAAKELKAQVAILRYDSVAESESKYAELAAHRAAQLVAQTRDTAEVARRYQVIQQRFPKGQLAKSALKELVDTRLQRQELHEARGALNRFIKENPAERHAKDLAFLSGEIFRREKKYSDAIREYQRSAGSQYDEDALYFSAWAMLQIDPNSIDGIRKLSRYQEQFPDGRHQKAVSTVLSAHNAKSP